MPTDGDTLGSDGALQHVLVGARPGVPLPGTAVVACAARALNKETTGHKDART